MDKFEHKEKMIEFEESPNPKISIDGEPTQVSHDADANTFNAGELPYRTYKSVKELAEEIVEQRLQYEQEGET